tara:strand:+ start:148 stop:660 length:513 start_codon:yes stop_codon:yes gene_type:complete
MSNETNINSNSFLDSLTDILPNIILAIAIIFVFWIAGKIIRSIVYKVLDRNSPNSNIARVLSSIAKNVVLTFGLITSLGTVGINVSAIVAGLGLTGFAFGFAFKDMLSNFISGVMIFIYEPFKIGDFIQVEKKEGKVVEINLRYVIIETETQKILVPNSISVSKVIVVNK